MFELKASVANTAWATVCQGARFRMKAALENPESAQREVLHRLLRANAGTVFGREHKLSNVYDAKEFQDAVPARNYEALFPWIERAADGEPHVLSAEPVLAFERSSGSTSAAKLIPFTAALRAEFQEAIRAWMGELYARTPSLLGGPSYWLISPLKQQGAFTEGGIPIGLQTDSEYLGRWEKKLSSWLFAVPESLAATDSLEESMDLTLRYLIGRPELRFISVWNPSFLLILWRRLLERIDEFLPRRAKRPIHPRDVWPRLAVISGWADCAGQSDAAETAALFDHAIFQPKGLLATEGVVTIPWGNGAVPALRSHFVEFVEVGGASPQLAHELEKDREYEVLLTTGGGLWRYKLGDVVRVVGYRGPTPVLRFIGRSDGVSDLRGEKLHPRFVSEIIDRRIQGFAMLAPAADGKGYILFVDRFAPGLAKDFDEALSRNPHYDYCRRAGQLEAVKIFLVTGDPQSAYLRRCENLGQRAGTVKATSLHRKAGWESWFEGRFVND